MRKYFIKFLSFVILSAITFSSAETLETFAVSYSVTSNKIIVELDDNILNLAKDPVIKDGVTLVPLREIANAMNIALDWDAKTKTIICSKDDIYLTFVIDSNIMRFSEDADVFLDVPPVLIDGTTYIPLRALSKALNSEVFWDSELQTVFIYSPVNSEDAVLSSKLTKLSLYIYALNDGICLDKGSYMTLAKILKPEYESYAKEFEYFSDIFNGKDSPFGKINIDYSNINSCEMKKAKKILNLSEDSVDVLIDEIKNFADKIGCNIPDYADYMSDIDLYEKYIENYTVRSIDDGADKPYTFKEKYAFAEKPYNRHIKKITKFKNKYLSDDPDKLIPCKDDIPDAEEELKEILEDVKTIYINLGISGKTTKKSSKTDIKPLIKADLDLTVYLKNFIKKASDLDADENGKTLKQKYSDYQAKYNSLYIKTLDTYSKLFKLNSDNPEFSAAFDTITKMTDAQIANCVKNITQLHDEWKFLAAKLQLKVI